MKYPWDTNTPIDANRFRKLLCIGLLLALSVGVQHALYAQNCPSGCGSGSGTGQYCGCNCDIPPGTCPIDVVLVLDESGSMANNDGATALRASVMTFLNALLTDGCGSRAAIVEYSSSARNVSINGSSGLQIIDQNFINCVQDYLTCPSSCSASECYAPGGGTNWNTGFAAAMNVGGWNDVDLVLHLTDGVPSNNGCTEADQIKTDGKHLFNVGVGTGINGANLSSVAGPDQWTSGGSVTMAEADYALITNPADLAAAFGAFARDLCRGTVTCSVSQEILCNGASTGSVTVEAPNATGTPTFRWYNVLTPGTTIPCTAMTSGGTTTCEVTGLPAGTYEVEVVDGCGNQEICQVVLDDGPPDPVMDAVDVTICSDDITNVTFSATLGVPPYTYELIAILNPGGLTPGAGNASTGSGVASNHIQNDTWTNTTGSQQTITYQVRAITADGCTGVSADLIVNVDPEPVLTSNLDVSVCSDVAIGISLSPVGGQPAGTTYNITALVDPGLSGTPTTGNGLGANAISGDIFTNTTSGALTVTYSITPIGPSPNNCQGSTAQVVATILPEPEVSLNLDNTVCSGEPSGITLSTGNGVSATSYDISAVVSAGLSGTATTGTSLAADAIANDIFTNTTGGPLTVTYTVTANGPDPDNCVGDALDVILTIDPEPVLASTLDATQCSDIPSGINLAVAAGSTGAATYDITAINMNGLTASAGNPTTGTGFGAGEIADDAYTNTSGMAVDVIYTIVPVSADGCLGQALDVTFTITPEPVLASNLDATQCSDVPSGIVLNTTAGTAASGYNITDINMNGLTPSAGNPVTGNNLPASEITDDAYTNTTGAPVDVVYTVVPVSGSSCEGDAVVVTFTINPEPVLSTALDATVCSDQPSGITLSHSGATAAATFDITAIYMNGLTASAGNPTTGTGFGANEIADDAYTNTTGAPVDVVYTIEPVSASACAGDAVQVTLTVDPEPVLASTLDATQCSDIPSGINLAVAPGSTGATTYDITAINMNGLTASAGNPTTGTGFGAGEIADDAYTNNLGMAVDVVYTIVPVSADGCLGEALDVIFTITPEPVLASNLDATQCSDVPSGIVLNTSAGTAASGYNITNINMNGLTPSAGNPVTGNNLPDNEIADDAYTNTTGAPVDVIYTVVPVSGSSCEGDAVVVTFTVNPEPVLSTALDATVCSDQPSGITLSHSGATAAATFDITAINMNGLTASAGNPTTGTGFGAGEIVDDAYTNTTGAPVDVVYTVVPVSASACAGDALQVTLTVDPEPVLASTLDATQCSDIPSGINLAVAAGSTGAATYDITAINMNGLTASAGNPTTGTGFGANEIADDAYTNSSGMAVDVVYTIVPVSADGCLGEALDVVFTITPEPVLASNLDATQCSDVPSGIVLNTTAGTAASGYNITNINMNGLTPSAGNPVTGNNLPDNEIADDAYTNTTGAPVDVVYTVVPVSGSSCEGDAVVVTFTVNPEPVLSTALDATVCSDQPSGITLSHGGATAAATFDITAINMNGLTASAGNPATGTGFGANEIVDDAYTNTTGAPVDVVYTVVPVSASACAGDALQVTLTVDPEPVLASTLDATQCSDIPSGINLAVAAGSTGAATYDITAINMNGLTASAGNPTTGTGFGAGEIADDAYTNNSGMAVDVVYTIVPVSADGCLGDALDVVFTITPEPVLASNLDATQCSDVPSGIVLSTTAGTAASGYNITNINMNGLIPRAGNPVTGNNLPASEIADDAYTNTTGAPVIVTYTIVPVSGSDCEGDAVDVELTILPEPLVMNYSEILCSGATLNSDLDQGINPPDLGLVLGYSYTVTSSDPANVPPGPNRNSPTASNVTDSYTNTTGTDVFITYLVTPALLGPNLLSICPGDPFLFTVTVTSEIVCNPSIVNVTCNGLSDGQVTVNASGGTAPYTYAWSHNGALTGPSASDLPAGSHSITITDANNCTGICTFTVTEPPVLTAAAAFVCNADGTADIDLTVAGGTAPYTYQWSGGLPAVEDPTSVVVDIIYSVTVTDANQCIVITTVLPEGCCRLELGDCPDDSNLSCIDDTTTVADDIAAILAMVIQDPGPCGPVTVTLSQRTETGDCGTTPGLTITRVYDVTDGITTLNCTFQQTIFDNTPPVAPPGLPDITVECSNIPAPVYPGPATDCGNDVAAIFSETSDQQPGCANYTITRTWTYTDPCGNSTVVQRVITVEDTTPPEVPNGPRDWRFACLFEVPAGQPLTARDDCTDTPLVANPVDEVIPGACPSNFDIIRRWIFEDNCGNRDTVTQNIIVRDVIVPELTCPPDLSFACIADVPPAYTDLSSFVAAGGSAFDHCDLDPTSFQLLTERSSGECPTVIRRTYQIADQCGNLATCQQTITVNDTTAPVIFTCLPDVVTACSNVEPTVATLPASTTLASAFGVTDNCTAIADLVVSASDSGPIITGCTYVFERVYTISDLCGNEASCTQRFTYTYDKEAPQISGYDEVVEIGCGELLPAPANVSVEDNCPGSVTLTYRQVNGKSGCLNESYTRYWTATDACGNSTQAVQYIYRVERALIEGPADTTIQCGEPIPEPVFEVETECSDLRREYREETLAGDCSCEYTIMRIWQFYNKCIGVVRDTQYVFVVDTKPPDVTIVNPMIADMEIGGTMVMYGCGMEPAVAMEDIVTDDCCGVAEVEPYDALIASSTCEIFGFYQKWRCGYIVTDLCGNQIDYWFNVLQYDTTAPRFVGDTIVNHVVACGDPIPEIPHVEAEDNCLGAVEVKFSQDTLGHYPDSFTLVRSWVAGDDCQNFAEQTQTITVCPNDPAAAIGSLESIVWMDDNRDGVQGNFEEGLNQVRVHLYQDGDMDGTPDGSAVSSDVTRTIAGRAGKFLFVDVAAGNYLIGVELKDELIFTAPHAGSNVLVDSDIDPTTGMSETFEIRAGEHEQSIDVGMTLPIRGAEISTFVVSQQDNCTNELRWSTQSEAGTDYFAVERSQDGVAFAEIDRVDAANNSTEARTYSQFDLQEDEITYYRLRVVNVDGSEQYSQVITQTKNCQSTQGVVLATFAVSQGADCANAVVWSTLTESASDKFVVERSTDGLAFEVVADIPAAGSSDEELQYSYEDTQDENIVYYRLRIIGLDGSEQTSDVIEQVKTCRQTALGAEFGAVLATQSDACMNTLQWTTLSQSGVSHFVVEFSENDLDYQRIGSVEAAGDTEDTQSYSFEHQQEVDRIFYRILVVNEDGSGHYSQVIEQAKTCQAGSIDLEFGAFSATQAGDCTNALEWSTLTESGISHFVIERSADGADFEEIGIVTSQGDSEDEQQYTFMDAQEQELLYYRLRAIGADASELYVTIITQYKNCSSPSYGVDLASFAVSQGAGCQNQLHWSTLSETGSESFHIERSSDGISFEEVGSLSAAGDSDDQIDYAYADTYEGGPIYYRIRIVLADGAEQMSELVPVTESCRLGNGTDFGSITISQGDDCLNTLKWHTTLETGSEEFIIEQSLDGIAFEEIGRVPASGNSAGQVFYEFAHDQKEQMLFYRIQITHRDGAQQWSEVVQQARDCVPRTSIFTNVYPNPVRDRATLLVRVEETGTLQIDIFDTWGKLMKHLSPQRVVKGETIQTISVQGWPAGMYWMRLTSDSETNVLPFRKAR